MSDNTELTEAEIMSLYNDIVEGPDYLAAAKTNNCPDNLRKKYSCGKPYTSSVSFSCCTSDTVCKDGKITTGGCWSLAD